MTTGEKIPLVAVLGPTASGKTGLAVQIALRFGGEVVSADSMQIYSGLNIATAAPTESEMLGVPHHLIGCVPPSEEYSVARYMSDAAEAIAGIYSRGRLPVLCGGTGLYADSLINGMSFEDEPDCSELRAELWQKYQSGGIEPLYARLAALDSEAAASIHPNNTKRVLRALEVCIATGESFTERGKRQAQCESPYDTLRIVLRYNDRQKLYDRINKRVDIMLEQGLVDEARRYYALDGVSTASQAIGYKEIKPYLDGDISLAEAVENLKRATRRYAKRQITWFSRSGDAAALYCDTPGELPDRAFALIEEFFKREMKTNE